MSTWGHACGTEPSTVRHESEFVEHAKAGGKAVTIARLGSEKSLSRLVSHLAQSKRKASARSPYTVRS